MNTTNKVSGISKFLFSTLVAAAAMTSTAWAEGTEATTPVLSTLEVNSSAKEGDEGFGETKFATVKDALDKANTLGGATINIVSAENDSQASQFALTNAGTYTVSGGNGEIFTPVLANGAGVNLTFDSAFITLGKLRGGKDDSNAYQKNTINIKDSVIASTEYAGYGGGWATFYDCSVSINNSIYGINLSKYAKETIKTLPRSASDVKEAIAAGTYELASGSGYNGQHIGTVGFLDIDNSTVYTGFFSVSDRGYADIDNSVIYVCGSLGVGDGKIAKANNDSNNNGWSSTSATDYRPNELATMDVTDSIVRNITLNGEGGGLQVGSASKGGILNITRSEFDFTAKGETSDTAVVYANGVINIVDSSFKAGTLSNEGTITVSGVSAIVTDSYSGNAVQAQGTLTDSTIEGGEVCAAGALTLAGTNTLGALSTGNNAITVTGTTSVTSGNLDIGGYTVVDDQKSWHTDAKFTLASGSSVDTTKCGGFYGKHGATILIEDGATLTTSGKFQNNGNMTVKGTLNIKNIDGDWLPKLAGTETETSSLGGSFVVDGGTANVDAGWLTFGGGQGSSWVEATGEYSVEIKNGGKISSTAAGFRNASKSVLTLDNGTLEFTSPSLTEWPNSTVFENTGKIFAKNSSTIDMSGRDLTNAGTISIEDGSQILVKKITNNDGFAFAGKGSFDVETVEGSGSFFIGWGYQNKYENTDFTVKSGTTMNITQNRISIYNTNFTIEEGATLNTDTSNGGYALGINIGKNQECCSFTVAGTMTHKGLIQVYGGRITETGELYVTGSHQLTTFRSGELLVNGLLDVDTSNALCVAVGVDTDAYSTYTDNTFKLTVTGTDGVLKVQNNLFVQKNSYGSGTLTITNKANASIGKELRNNGLVNVGEDSTLTAGTVANDGKIEIDGGSLTAVNVTNNGSITLNNATLIVTGTLTNNGTLTMLGNSKISDGNTEDASGVALREITVATGSGSEVAISATANILFSGIQEITVAEGEIDVSSITNGKVAGAWHFDIDGIDEGQSVTVSTTVDTGLNLNTIKVFHKEDGTDTWDDVTDDVNLTYDAETGAVSFTTNTFSSYAVAIPEPSAFGLLAGVGAIALAVSRRRRRTR